MYIEQAQKNLTNWWRYVLGIIIVFLGTQIGSLPLLGGIFYKAMFFTANNNDEMLSKLQKAAENNDIQFILSLFDSNVGFLFLLLSFFVGFIFFIIVIKYLHKQSFRNISTSRNKIDWNRVFTSFSIWGSFTIIFSFIGIYFSPEDYVFNFELNRFLILSLIAILFLPIQTSLEEYFFRGYLMQGIGNIVKNRWFPLIFTSVGFGLMHYANPEIGKIGNILMVYYIGTGLFLGIITLMDDGLELALGFHAANNLFAALLITADWTVFQTYSIYIDVSDPSKMGVSEIIAPIFVIFPILVLIFSKIYNWTNWYDRLIGPVKNISNSEVN